MGMNYIEYILMADDLLHHEWWNSRRGASQDFPGVWCEQVDPETINSHNLGNYLLILYDTLSVENSSTPFASSSKNKKIEYVKVDSTFSPADVSF